MNHGKTDRIWTISPATKIEARPHSSSRGTAESSEREMESLTENVVMTGGVVAHNPFLVTMSEEMLGRKLLVPDHPQLTGAIGAALYAIKAKEV